ncbi:MAG: hypothetical protein KIS87_00760 [Phycisphaeraceae bacterium]|nr:hypothetical protein [Phycisphaeraceae bacterium]
MPPLEDDGIRRRIVEALSAPRGDERVQWSSSARRGLESLFGSNRSQGSINKIICAWVQQSRRVNVVNEVMEEYREQGDRYEIRIGIHPHRIYLYFYLIRESGADVVKVGQFKQDSDYES